MSASQKHADFVRETMRDKPIESISGVGDWSKTSFNEKGLDKAYHLLGEFLLLSKDITLFDQWLETNAPRMKPKNRGDVIKCLQEWCDKNL